MKIKDLMKLGILVPVFLMMTTNTVSADAVNTTIKGTPMVVSYESEAMDTISIDKLVKYYEANLNVAKYKALNPDLVRAFGKNADDSLFIRHYLEFGIKEGRNIGSFDALAVIINNYDLFMENGLNSDFKFFDVDSYKAMYPDLQAAFGEDIEAYLNHYIKYGVMEGRTFDSSKPGKVDLVAVEKEVKDKGLIVNFRSNETLDVIEKVVDKIDDNTTLSVPSTTPDNDDVKDDDSSSTDEPVVDDPIVDVPDSLTDAEWETLLDYCRQVLGYWVDYQDDTNFEDGLTIEEYNDLYKLYEELLNKLYSNKNDEDIDRWENELYPGLLDDFDLDSSDDVDYIDGLVEVDGVIYDKQAYQNACKLWIDSEPDRDSYLNDSDYHEDLDAWQESQPDYEDYTVGYASEDAAKEAYESDLADWEAGKPDRDSFDGQEDYDAALEEYLAENPEPSEDDYVYYEDWYNNEELAQAAYESACDDWAALEPDRDSFNGQEEYDAALEEWESLRPSEDDYVYNENRYASQDEADAAYGEAYGTWENREPQPEDFVNEEEYEAAVEEWQAGKPSEDDYTYYENTYASQDEATAAYNSAVEDWGVGRPSEDDYTYYENTYASQDEADEAYNSAVSDWETEEPLEDDYTYYENTYASQDEADEAYDTDVQKWSEDRQSVLDTAGGDESNEDFLAWLAENPEPSEDDYVYHENEYASQDEATAAYESDLADWEAEEPSEDDYVYHENRYASQDEANEAYESDLADWEAEEPSEDDYVYYENEYASQDEANEAYESDLADWEAEEPSEDDYIDTDTFIEECEKWNESKPSEDDFVYHENEYASQDEATAAYESAVSDWEAEEPDRDSFDGQEDYAAALEEWEAEKPVEDDFMSKINEYESEDAANAAYESAVSDWEAGKPDRDSFDGQEDYDAALEEYLAENPEPSEDDYVVGEYRTSEEADEAYNADVEEWMDKEPVEDDYLDDYYDAVEEWRNEEPELTDFPVEDTTGDDTTSDDTTSDDTTGDDTTGDDTTGDDTTGE